MESQSIARATFTWQRQTRSIACQKLGPDGTFTRRVDARTYMAHAGSLSALMLRFMWSTQGRTRIVKFNPDGQVLARWGSKGSGDGQFIYVSWVAVDPTKQ